MRSNLIQDALSDKGFLLSSEDSTYIVWQISTSSAGFLAHGEHKKVKTTFKSSTGFLTHGGASAESLTHGKELGSGPGVKSARHDYQLHSNLLLGP